MSRYTACCYAIIISSLFFLVSCSKDQIPTVPPVGGSVDSPDPIQKKAISFVAKNWVKDVTYNYYFCNLNNLVTPDGFATIYLLDGNVKKEISRNGSLRYMNGNLSLSFSNLGGALIYVSDVSTDKIPFSSVETIIEYY